MEDEDVDSLLEENERLHQRLHAQEKELAEAQRRVENANAARALLSQQRTGKKALDPLRQINKRLDEWEERSHEWEQERSSLNDALEDANEELDRVLHENDHFKRELDTANARVSQLSQENAIILNDLHNMSRGTYQKPSLSGGERAVLTSKMSKQEEELARVQAEYYSLVDEHLDLSRTMRERERDHKKSGDKILELELQNSSLAEDLSRAQSTVDTLMAERKIESERHVQELNTSLETHNEHRTAQQDEIRNLQDELESRSSAHQLQESRLRGDLITMQEKLDGVWDTKTGRSRCRIPEHMEIEHNSLFLNAEVQQLREREDELTRLVLNLEDEVANLHMLARRHRWSGGEEAQAVSVVGRADASAILSELRREPTPPSLEAKKVLKSNRIRDPDYMRSVLQNALVKGASSDASASSPKKKRRKPKKVMKRRMP